MCSDQREKPRISVNITTAEGRVDASWGPIRADGATWYLSIRKTGQLTSKKEVNIMLKISRHSGFYQVAFLRCQYPFHVRLTADASARPSVCTKAAPLAR